MIDLKIDDGHVERCLVEGTPSGIITEVTCILGAIYKEVIESAMKELSYLPKPYIHKKMRSIVAERIAQAMAITDSEIIKSYATEDATVDFLSEFMKDLMGEEGESDDE